MSHDRLPIDLVNAERPIGDRPPRSTDSEPDGSARATLHTLLVALHATLNDVDLGVTPAADGLDAFAKVVREATGG